MQTILEVKDLKVHYALKKGLFKAPKIVHAVDGVDFTVNQAEVLGIVGESGCGKSSLARGLVGLTKITSGKIIFLGQHDLATASKGLWHKLRQNIQFIFQDPIACLDPRMTVLEIIAEPLKIYNPKLTTKQVQARVIEMMQLVGLAVNQINRYPSEFSGGQCQRIGIARALILQPKFIICDESVSALDVSIKSQIINLLKDLQRKLNLTIVFISHDLSIVKHICDRVLVMYLGKVMELSTKDNLYNNKLHPYTQALLNAVPLANPRLERGKCSGVLDGDLPSPISPPVGCVFNTRCPRVGDICRRSRPPLRTLKNGSQIACFKVDD